MANQHLVLSVKRTGEQVRPQDMFIVHTSVGEKVRFGKKQYQAEKKSSS